MKQQVANILALDIGEKRIGVAIADASTPFPVPLTTLEASENLVSDFKSILEKHTVSTIVIGLPRNQSGERTVQTDRVEHIAKLLAIPTTIPIHWQDESLTSVKAEEELKKRKKHFKKADVDALAATYILEDFITNKNNLPLNETAVDQTNDAVNVDKKGAKAKKPKKKRLFLKILLALVTVVIVAVLASIGWYLHALTPRTVDDLYSVISIEEGMGAQQIATQLEHEEVIRSARAFAIYVRLNGVNNLQAGEYRLSSKQSVSTIVETLSSGTVTTVNVLISPGLRLDQIIELLKKDGYTEEDINSALIAVRNHPLLEDLPASARLEGYLFPDTYNIGPTTSAEQLLRLMLDTFSESITEDTRDKLSRQGIPLADAVILASIIQKEVPDYPTQQKVAQVFLKRLDKDIPLGADPTFKYAAAITGQAATPALDSPYNTRINKGLPPTAIANFNISALEAVANPSDTDFLYFVSGDNGTTYFSKTEAEHETLTERYCTELCQ